VSAAAPPRVDWVERQLLDGGDLRTAHRFLDVLRARHVRGAHGTWGVALGLKVRLAADGQSVQIDAGLAYDAGGRELLLARAVELPLTSSAMATTGPLVIALRSRGDWCVPRALLHAVSESEPLVLGRDVPIASIDLKTGTVDIERRPHVATLAPPRIGAGTIVPGGVAVSGTVLALSAQVDTGLAGFETTPSYLVQPFAVASVPTGALGPLLAVEGASATGFTLHARYVYPTAGAVSAGIQKAKPAALPFGIHWVGVEAPPECGVTAAPDPDCPCLL
jgi:hypothetical protein